MGSVRYRTDRHGNRIYYITYDGPRKANGMRDQRKKTIGTNKKEAQAALRDIESAIERGEVPAKGKLTLYHLAEEYLRHAEKSLAPSTFEIYRLTIRKHILPRLGGKPLQQLRPLDIERFVTDLGTACHSHGGSTTISAKTVRNVFLILHRMLRKAVAWRMIPSNPATGVELQTPSRPQMKVASSIQIRTLLRVAAEEEGGRWHLPVLIAAATAARRGEVLALQWQDFLPDEGRLIIRRALSPVAGKGVMIKGTKTDRIRVVNTPPILTTALIQHQKMTPHSKADDWICSKDDGTHLNPLEFSRAFIRIAKKAGVDIKLHGLRHSQVTNLMAKGVPMKVISERLGHASTTITNDVYAHATPTMQQAATDLVEEMLTDSQDPLPTPRDHAADLSQT